MTKTQNIFNEAIIKSAELVKMINEDGFEQDDKEVDKINDEISELECQLLDLPYDFEIGNLKKYITDIVDKNYFIDERCWNYLYDVVYDIESNIGFKSF